MLGFRFAQQAGEGKLLVVAHVLVGKAQHRIGIDRLADQREISVWQIARERCARHACAERVMKGFDGELRHRRHAGVVRYIVND